MAQPAPRDEYRVDMQDRRRRKCFTLVNAYSEDEARERAELNHPDKTIVAVYKSGRKF